ncbi:MAG: Zonular occludens toxin [Candidatus Dactylopiibacterium carminicum]|uniref:Zonular occludens toxin n=1 Tax=Candidatus Dactylopiibacterium carminicum TaxID=857335 RepID=A0A272EWP0_9RHOO|nr:zonular occludens toxin domain-containing protein [Candidatus Dactylopiibacterium carminicum]KAF7600090.1 Zonular occludens toxin [Candidatus Dactylopiibacterium carminicum]PAS94080.1 MAG: Zonular occludens toxin [Candidatus Dactylopiibacterium carminicum]PAS98157.1 MAG: Zonular occludens toxin [Candidatus Dactylopiibacterium carminicum]PAT00092.1 MAG: hypothetical protein BSR46_04170 [Candidatus Dactylopiibacterium carminicum]
MSTLNLHTGLPGASKTLYTINHVMDLTEAERKEAERQGKPYERQVYFHNIRGCKVPGWIEMEDPRKWFELPVGAIIVIDEAQDIFRPRGTGSQVPDHVAQMEKHRHRGYSIFLITQHPMLIDNNIRRLVTKHRHMVRAFGKHYATVHAWDKCKEQCDKNRDDSEKTPFPYPKNVFDLYQSAELHVVKGRMPWRLLFLFLMPALLAVLIFGVWRWLAPRMDEKQAVDRFKNPSIQATGAPATPGQNPVTGKLTTFAYLEAHQARIPGLPNTAPIYDDVTKPTVAPYPAACVTLKSKGCRCYSQQATRIDVPQNLCESIVERGYFVAWDQGQGTQQPFPVSNQPVTSGNVVTSGDLAIAAPALGIGGLAAKPRL